MVALVFSYLVLAIILIYCIHFLGYVVAILVAREEEWSVETDSFKKVSLIIPVRNEIRYLRYIVSDLLLQSYPVDYFEVLFIDDHSDDGSGEYLNKICKENSQFKMFMLEADYSGKKQAINIGVENASGEWIIQTDADCRIPKDFITGHASLAAKSKVSLIAGPVKVKADSGLWNRLEALEFMSLSGTGMASFLTGKPVMCNGANLSYSKEFYVEAKEELFRYPSVSGDDIFLMTEAKKRQKEIAWLFSSRLIVTTEPAGSIRAFLKQRIRWGSKARLYSDGNLIRISILVMLVNVLLTALFITMFFNSNLVWLFWAALGMKSFVDFCLLFLVARFYREKRLLWFFPLTAIFYYFYITITGALSILGDFSWKGRAFSRKDT